VYTGSISSLVACGGSVSVIEYLICDNGVNKIVQIPVNNGVLGTPVYLLLDRTASTAPTNWSLVQAGGCSGIYAEDSAHVSGSVGQFILGVRNDADSILTNANQEYIPLSTGPAGHLKVAVQASDQTSSTLGLLKQEDAPHASGHFGVFPLGVANQNLIDLAQEGDYIANAKTVKGVGLETLVRANALAFSERSIYTNDEPTTSNASGIPSLFLRTDSLANRTDANLDISVGVVDSFGRRLVNLFAPVNSYVFGNLSLTNTSSTSLVAAAGAGLRIYVTNISITNTGTNDSLITFQNGSGGATLWRTIAPNKGGSNVTLHVPFFTNANTALFVQAETASTTIYISVSGFIAP
jgi:hypothetical protein